MTPADILKLLDEAIADKEIVAKRSHLARQALIGLREFREKLVEKMGRT